MGSLIGPFSRINQPSRSLVKEDSKGRVVWRGVVAEPMKLGIEARAVGIWLSPKIGFFGCSVIRIRALLFEVCIGPLTFENSHDHS